jgi:hypothetical protein
MAIPQLQERTLTSLSQIQVRYFTAPASQFPYLEILVIRYVGRYPDGSAGNEDAQFMCAMAKAGVAAYEPWGVIHDLSELAYDWGDRLDLVFTVGPKEEPSGVDLVRSLFSPKGPRMAAQPAVVVGPASKEAVRTLLLGQNSEESIEAIGYVFLDFDAAWEFVDAQIA